MINQVWRWIEKQNGASKVKAMPYGIDYFLFLYFSTQKGVIHSEFNVSSTFLPTVNVLVSAILCNVIDNLSYWTQIVTQSLLIIVFDFLFPGRICLSSWCPISMAWLTSVGEEFKFVLLHHFIFVLFFNRVGSAFFTLAVPMEWYVAVSHPLFVEKKKLKQLELLPLLHY